MKEKLAQNGQDTKQNKGVQNNKYNQEYKIRLEKGKRKTGKNKCAPARKTKRRNKPNVQ